MMQKIVAVALLLCLLCPAALAQVYELPDGRNVVLAVGGSFAYARTASGEIRVWGDNQFGQLGKGSTRQSFQVSPFKTKNAEIDPSCITDIVPANDYSFLMMSDGSVYGVGNNSYLPLTKKEGNYTTHVRVALPEAPAAMATGFGHAMMLTQGGEVYAWGRNSQGQVGNGGTKKTQTPSRVPVENIVQIACGGKFSLALDRDVVLWGWGDNEFHELLPDTTKNQTTPVRIDTGDIDIAVIDACGASVVLLDKNGTLWTWGNNSYGQLGQGFRSVASQGVLPGKCWDSDVALVMGGSLYVVAMLQDGTVLTAGISKFGQLGRGDAKSQYALSPNGMNLITD